MKMVKPSAAACSPPVGRVSTSPPPGEIRPIKERSVSLKAHYVPFNPDMRARQNPVQVVDGVLIRMKTFLSAALLVDEPASLCVRPRCVSPEA